MGRLFFSPHSTSVDNEEGRASGHADVPLSQEGERLAREWGRRYESLSINRVFCSDLIRACRTAEIAFGPAEVPIVADARLREIDYGEMTQGRVETVKAEFPRRVSIAYPGGESLMDVADRVGSFIRDVSREHTDETVVVIGHAATKHAIDFWLGDDSSMDEIVRRPWEWLEFPSWEYAFDQDTGTRP